MHLFENVGRLRDDDCEMMARELHNTKLYDYAMYDRNYDFTCQAGAGKCLQDFGTTNRRVYREGYGPNPCSVDKVNDLVFSRMTNDKKRVQLCPCTFGGVPSIGLGIVMPEVEDRICQGEMRYSKRTCDSMNPLEGMIDTFVPLVPCMQKIVQNTDFIVPQWTAGGIPMRDIDQQRKFLSETGYAFDGKLWQKKYCP
eukprot:gene19646-26332_t